MQKKNNSTLNNRIVVFRTIILAALFGVVIFLFLCKIFQLQVIMGDYYSSMAVPKVYRQSTLEMSRGQIYDRNGVVLVSNVKSYNVSVDGATLDSSDYNSVLLKFVEFCEQYGIELTDNLPVTDNYPHILDEDYIFDDKKTSMLNKFIRVYELNDKNFLSDDNALYSYLCDRYDINHEIAKQDKYRKLIGIRYDMETNDFEYLKTFTLLYDIDETVRTLLSEKLHTMHGIVITTSDERYYNQGALASHILGRTGKLDISDVEEYVEKRGYSYDAVIGKDGVEKAFESYLHGYDGLETVEIDENNNIVDKETNDPGSNGYSVLLTIDSGMQKVAEDALQKQIDFARSQGLSDFTPYNGEDCFAGAVVVMNPKNGQIYVCASCPNFDLNTFSDQFSLLNTDTQRRPLVNRATMGIYPPGSTFKIATAIAALCEDVITSDTLVYDAGVYTKYSDRGYDPECWIYSNSGRTHGYMNVKTAIENSCNYFFYKIGDDMGIDALTRYASLLGLGQQTGIEVPESTGILASPAFRDSKGLLWNPGDTLQAAIGQSDNAFTPLQLCSYMCAVLSGGVRYKATLLFSVLNFYTNEVVYKSEPEILSTVALDEEDVELLKSAMKSVVVDGTAKNVFDNYKHEIGGKTGTAQVSGGSDTALFVGFAPYDDPEIVVSVVVENGHQSSRASEVAKAVFDYYFAQKEENNEEIDINENEETAKE